MRVPADPHSPACTPALEAVTSAIKSRNNTELSLIESSLMTEAYHLVDEDSFLLVVEAGE
jgi:hypothetical protein